jgi:hypothetical protein
VIGRELPPEWAPALEGGTPEHDPWDTAYSLWMIAAVLFAVAAIFGGEYLIATR